MRLVRVADPSKPINVNSIAELNFGIPGPGRITIEVAVDEVGLPLMYLQAHRL